MDFGMPYLLELSSIEACCQLARELCLDFVELNANFPECAAERLQPEGLTELADRYGLYFTFHVEEECDPFTFNATVRRAWLDTLRQSFDLAVACGMPIVNMHFPKGVYITLPGEKVYLFERCEREFASAFTEFRQLCESCLSGTKTRIAIENTNGWMPFQRQAIRQLLESPLFGLTLDIGHSHAIGDTDEVFFCQHDDRLIHMHGHDAAGKRNHLALGDGQIALRERLAWAERRNARVVLETKTVEALRVSVARLADYH